MKSRGGKKEMAAPKEDGDGRKEQGHRTRNRGSETSTT